jgi:hypothetical protein
MWYIIVQCSFGDLTEQASPDLSLSTQSGTFKKQVRRYYNLYTFIIVPAIAEHQLREGRQHKR